MRIGKLFPLGLALALSAVFQPFVMAATGSATGEERGYWGDHSVAVAQVIELVKRKEGEYFDRLRLYAVGTLSGRFDATESVQFDVAIDIYSESVFEQYPKAGDVILAVVEYEPAEPSFRSGYDIPNGYASFMPADRDDHRVTLYVLDGSATSAIDETLTAIQKARKISDAQLPRPRRRPTQPPAPTGFWRDHCLLCCDVDAVEYPGAPGHTPRLTLLPKMAISGLFDAGKTPKINVDAPISDGISLPTAGNKILILLARDGDRFSLYTGRAEFMPGEHSSICVVKDFLSPFVLDTAKAVQEARAKERKPEQPRDSRQARPEPAEAGTRGLATPAEKSRAKAENAK
jgi:hypothetical protein